MGEQRRVLLVSFAARGLNLSTVAGCGAQRRYGVIFVHARQA